MKVLRVGFYSGSRSEEYPREIYTDSGTITVDKIIETNLEENFESKTRTKIFVFQSREKDFYQLEVRQGVFKLKRIGIGEE